MTTFKLYISFGLRCFRGLLVKRYLRGRIWSSKIIGVLPIARLVDCHSVTEFCYTTCVRGVFLNTISEYLSVLKRIPVDAHCRYDVTFQNTVFNVVTREWKIKLLSNGQDFDNMRSACSQATHVVLLDAVS